MKKRKIVILAIIFILFYNICYTETIQKEIERVERKDNKYQQELNNLEGQVFINAHSSKLYSFWEDELNSLWKRLIKEVDTKTKKKLLKQQRAWIKRKEKNIEMAGKMYEGGSIQSQIMNTRGKDMTRARVYILAKYLAHVRNEPFIISEKIQKIINYADPSLDDVFKVFEGNWEIYGEKGKYINIERSDMCFYDVEGSNWTLWITDGIILSDLNVYNYTQDSIIFKNKNTFYQLTTNIGCALIFTWGNSLKTMDNYIGSDAFINKYYQVFKTYSN